MPASFCTDGKFLLPARVLPLCCSRREGRGARRLRREKCQTYWQGDPFRPNSAVFAIVIAPAAPGG
jgi:hypothetical protein